jgi:hypothetical protein
VAQVQQLAARQRAAQAVLAETPTVEQAALGVYLEAAAVLTVVQVLLVGTVVS